MSSIFDISSSSSSSSSYSDLFSSLTTSSSDSSSSLLSDWASIKNGSYAKITKAYYAKEDSTSTVDSDEAKATIKANTTLKSDVTSTKTALEALSASSLYEKVDKKDADGNVTTDYDWDKIGKKLQSFVDSYNEIIESSVDSDNNRILRNTLSMTNITKANSNLLSDIGITVNDDNTLSLDTDALKEANINDLKSLFLGSGSYADQIDSRASELVNQINIENNKLSNYTSAGTYVNVNAVGNIYDGTY